jgi:hypothetical protein
MLMCNKHFIVIDLNNTIMLTIVSWYFLEENLSKPIWLSHEQRRGSIVAGLRKMGYWIVVLKLSSDLCETISAQREWVWSASVKLLRKLTNFNILFFVFEMDTNSEVQLLQERIRQLEQHIESLQAQVRGVSKRPKIEFMSEEVVDTNPYRCVLFLFLFFCSCPLGIQNQTVNSSF